MPKPPILPQVDWKAVYASGVPFEVWMSEGESEINRDAMVQLTYSQPLDPHVRGLLKAIGRPVHVVAIAEDWCGDVVRHVPVLRKFEEVASRLHVRFVTREQHPDVFVRFLTNGGEAIPKFIFLNDQFVECGNWGPMPASCRLCIARGKAYGNGKTAREQVNDLYNADPEKREVIAELLAHIDIACTAAPFTSGEVSK
jgi:hypothetical protein